jgi:hypothetical protein
MVIIVGVDTTPSPSGPLPITNLSAIHWNDIWIF